jgi:hypothetical protein
MRQSDESRPETTDAATLFAGFLPSLLTIMPRFAEDEPRSVGKTEIASSVPTRRCGQPTMNSPSLPIYLGRLYLFP